MKPKLIFRRFVVWALGLSSKILLFRHKPEVIGITGSAGKTSTKEFIAKLLDIDFNILAPKGGYNTEIGAPLALFEEDVPKDINSVFGWLGLLARTLKKAITSKHYPEKIIVEMGADKPDDIKKLCKIFKPRVGIVLAVLPTHLLEFKTIIGVFREKSQLAQATPADGKLFLNWDDERVREMATLTKTEVVFFGQENKDGYVASNLESDIKYLSFNLSGPRGIQTDIKVRLYGKQMVYPILSAISVALENNISLAKIKETLKTVRPFPGRMNVIEGVNDTIIIDDSYNANPKSTIESLAFLKKQKGRRIALLGNMNELGDYEVEGHEIVGESVAGSADLLITVGDVSKSHLAKKALKCGMSKDKVSSFKTSEEAGSFLLKNLKKGDIVLAKGSQNKVRMEKAVEIIMKDKKNKKKILVRQSDFWNKES